MKGILFKPDMIKAIVEGRKTVTRRIMKPQPYLVKKSSNEFWKANLHMIPEDVYVWQKSKNHFWYAWKSKGFKFDVCAGNAAPYHFDETVYIKEAFSITQGDGNPNDFYVTYRSGGVVAFRDNAVILDYPINTKWMSPLFMPAWAARYFLKIKDIRPERLQEINSDRHDEVLKEGYPFIYDINTLNEHPVNTYARYWNSINGKGSWESNQFVWRYEFERVEK